jgi:hypothetical protein
MTTTIKLTPAQAAALSGDITWNSNGSAYVTTGRENTLASLRRMGMLHGSLLTTHGHDARVTVQGGSVNVITPENGESETMYAKPYTPGQPVSVYATVKGETEEFEAAHIPNGDPERVAHFMAWVGSNPEWTNVRAANYVPNSPAPVEMAVPDAPIQNSYVTIDPTPGNTVIVSVGQHSMEIRDGSDVRLRAAFWARGHGYRPVSGKGLKWHRTGHTVRALVSLATPVMQSV